MTDDRLLTPARTPEDVDAVATAVEEFIAATILDVLVSPALRKAAR